MLSDGVATLNRQMLADLMSFTAYFMPTKSEQDGELRPCPFNWCTFKVAMNQLTYEACHEL